MQILDRTSINKSIFRIVAMIMVMIFLLAGCAEETIEAPETVIGDEGILFARSIATRFPVRNPGSEEESAVGDLIITELRKMGYTPEITEFKTGDLISRNISVVISGQGFVEDDQLSGSETEPDRFHKRAVIGVHYDTPLSAEDLIDNPDYDGIHDNASAVGALISVAKEILGRSYEYDIELVFFGAGNNDFAGAEYFVSELTETQISEIDVMYCISSIYAGDKLYAHSGNNSLEADMKYIRRRKLYEISDVAIANRIDLRFNESDLDVDVNGDEVPDVYREITITRSDHSVFDELGITCVFIESFEYFTSAQADQTESKNPYFGETKGMIKGTKYDSSGYLLEVLEEGRLESRIKNVAFLIVNALEKGIYR